MIFAATHDGVKGDLRGHTVVYSGDFELVFPRPQTVTVRVKYGDTGQPAAKLFVEAYNGEGSDWKTSDSDGRVNLRLPPGNYTLSMSPALNTPYLNTETKIAIPAKPSSKPIDAKIDAAATVNVVVRDAENGAPLSNVDFWTVEGVYRPSGRFFKRVYGYRAWEVETGIYHYVSPRTDSEGRGACVYQSGRLQRRRRLGNLSAGLRAGRRNAARNQVRARQAAECGIQNAKITRNEPLKDVAQEACARLR